MYIAQVRGRQAQGTKFWYQQKPLVTSVICYKFQKIPLKSNFIHFFYDFIHVYSPMARADNPFGDEILMPTGTSRSFVTSFKKCLWSLILYNCFHNLNMYIAPRQGQSGPRGQNLMSTETSCHFGHLLQVSKNLFEIWLYTFCHDFIHVYNPGAATDSPQGTKFLCQQKCLVTSFICCKFQTKCLWSLILNIFFFMFYTCI